MDQPSNKNADPKSGSVTQGSRSPANKDDGGVDDAIEAAEKAISGHPLARGFLLGSVVTVAVLIFVIQNRADIAVEWLWFDFDAALWIVILVAFLAGGTATPLMWVAAKRIYRRRADQRAAISRFGRAKGKKAPPRAAKPS